MFIYIRFGIPESISSITLMYTSPTWRAFFILGFANVVVVILYLGNQNSELFKSSVSKHLLLIYLFITGALINQHINEKINSFFTFDQIVIASIIFVIFNFLPISWGRYEKMKWIHYSICLIILLPNIQINPVSKGLEPFTNRKLYSFVQEIEQKSPNSIWNVYGQYQLSGFLKAAGINVFNGVQYCPPLEKLHILDPNKFNDSIYNRYAHIIIQPCYNQDTAKFKLLQGDLYEIEMDPCSPNWRKLGVSYSVFSYIPNSELIRCMTLIKQINNISIYKHNGL